MRTSGISMRSGSFIAAIVLAVLNATFGLTAADPVGVSVVNETVATLCAEEDNVYFAISGAGIRSFRVGAHHPAYIGTIVADSSAADYTNCDRSTEQFHEFDTRRVTLYEDRSIWLIGYVYERYWRDKDVPVRVGDRVEHNLHMIQLWLQGPRGPEEFLVLYPPDGYWRLRPLTPAHLTGTAYGSSVLIGPVENKLRPIIEINDVRFDPEMRSFRLSFERGGSAVVTVTSATKEGTVLDVRFDNVPADGIFAGVRSMYVAPGNADASEIGWHTGADRAWQFEPIPGFESGDDIHEVWIGRHIVSRHNTSAPNVVFGGFEAKD